MVKHVPQANEKSAKMGWHFDPGFIQNVQRVAADVENPSMEAIDSVLFALREMGFIKTQSKAAEMEVLDCPRCLIAPDLLEDGVIYHCGILAANAKRWNNYVHAMRLGLTLSFSNATGQPIDFDELNESSAAFYATYKEDEDA